MISNVFCFDQKKLHHFRIEPNFCRLNTKKDLVWRSPAFKVAWQISADFIIEKMYSQLVEKAEVHIIFLFNM